MEEGNAPATKADLAALETRLSERHDMLRTEMHHAFDDLKETLRDTQTELLKAFYNYAQGNDERVLGTENDSNTLKKRLAIVESTRYRN